MSQIPHYNDVLYLIVQYLHAKGLFLSSLTLQQESGLDVSWLRGYSHEVALLRRWIFAGDVKRARALLQPLKNLPIVCDELNAALVALDELEIQLMHTQIKKHSHEGSRLAQAKLKCFAIVMPLFRAPLVVDDSNAFKYVVMPKLQLVGLVQDAMLYHTQTSNPTAQDCISVTCTTNFGDLTNETKGELRNRDLLLLDEPYHSNWIEYSAIVPAAVNNLTQSVEWKDWRRGQLNPTALSMSVAHGESLGELDSEDKIRGEIGTEETLVRKTVDVAVSCTFDVKDTANVAVNCALDKKSTTDVAVSCEPEIKRMVNVAVGCKPEAPETCQVAVSCGPTGWSDVTTQTEILLPVQLIGSDCWSKGSERTERKVNLQPEAQETNNGIYSEDVFKTQTEAVTNQLIPLKEQSTQDVPVENVAKFHFNSHAVAALRNPEASSRVDRSTFSVMSTEDAKFSVRTSSDKLMGTGTKTDAEMMLLQRPPRCYEDFTLDHAVCACVIAEVKEPQAVRALDVHPNGTQLAVGTNARALRVFDLSAPLQQRLSQLPSSLHFNDILPLLPVTHERHKHHDSGIYCVSYNRHLFHQAKTASMIASGAADGSIKVLDTRKKSLHEYQTDEMWVQRGDVTGLMGKTRALEFSSSHFLWAASTNDHRVCCWDIRQTDKNSKCRIVQTLDGHVGEIQAITKPHPPISSTILLSAALDKTVRLWDTRSRRCQRLVTSGPSPAFSLHFHPTDETLAVSAHQDGSVSLWDLRSTAREALQIVVPHKDECRSVRWSPGGKWLLSAAFDGTLCIMQATNSTLQPVASYHKHDGKVLQAQWHPLQPAFVTCGADKRVKLWSFS